ncbi:HET-E1 [Symbiodinium necroappetens]|uniref:HET-E1 protein n=1 Tax=Symbiodinium necroappetens TaxID=1628268 RepID=A0A813BAW4_9DINO|nr:HET-E1 [Symbiodinium necroappetens]
MSLILSSLCGTVNTCPQCDTTNVIHVFSQDEVQYVGVSNDVAETVKVDVPCFELERASLLGTLRERLSQQGLELEDMPDTTSQDFLRLCLDTSKAAEGIPTRDDVPEDLQGCRTETGRCTELRLTEISEAASVNMWQRQFFGPSAEGAWAEVDTNPYWRYVLHSIGYFFSGARPPGLHMELTILDYLGLPEGSILSVRSGPTRRQSPLPCSAPFRLPPGPWPLRIDVLGLLGKSSSHIVLTSGENGLCRLPLEGKDGRPMSVTFQVCTENGPRPKTSPSLSRRLEDAAPVKKRDAEADARAYLDTHRLHEFMHGLFELLLRERPEDPYSFMATRFRQAAAMEAQSEGAGPGSGLKASRSSVSTAPTSATSLSLSSPTRDSSLAATTLSASFGEVPEGAFKVWVRSMRGRSIAKLVVGPKEKVGSLKQRLPGAAASSQLLWLGEMLPNDSTLEDWFVEPGLVMLNVVSSQKEPKVRHILSGASEGGIRLWNPANAEKVQDMTPLVQSAILAMVACWERMRVLCTTSDGRMQLWDLSEGTCLNSVVAHQDEAGCVAVDWATEQAKLS